MHRKNFIQILSHAYQTTGLQVLCNGNALRTKSPSSFLKPDLCDAIVTQFRCKGIKAHLDHSKIPKLNEEDLQEQCVKGSGPGGQATNKTNNAVVLKHVPTGIVVKCHQTRSLWDNKKRAREILIMRLDNIMNGEHSLENQERILRAERSKKQTRKREKMLMLKAAFKEREGID